MSMTFFLVSVGATSHMSFYFPQSGCRACARSENNAWPPSSSSTSAHRKGPATFRQNLPLPETSVTSRESISLLLPHITTNTPANSVTGTNEISKSKQKGDNVAQG